MNTKQTIIKEDHMNFTFNFTEAETNLLLKALGELPARESFALIVAIQNGATAQVNAAKEAEAKKKEVEKPQEKEIDTKKDGE